MKHEEGRPCGGPRHLDGHTVAQLRSREEMPDGNAAG
jgi:hypothetical protein